MPLGSIYRIGPIHVRLWILRSHPTQIRNIGCSTIRSIATIKSEGSTTTSSVKTLDSSFNEYLSHQRNNHSKNHDVNQVDNSHPQIKLKLSMKMQRQAIELLSLTNTLNYGNHHTKPTKFLESHQKLMRDAVRIIRFFVAPENSNHSSLYLMEEAHHGWARSESQKDGTNPFPLHGNLIAYSILKNILLPHIISNSENFRQGVGNLNEIAVLIDLSHDVIQSLSSTLPKTGDFNHGHWSEELLRMLLTCTYIPRTELSLLSINQSNYDVMHILRYIQNRLIFTCNATINVWATIASSKLANASMAKEAALHAEKFLLEMVSTPRKDISTSEESSITTWIQPDVTSFNTVIKAWANYGRAYHQSYNSQLGSNKGREESLSTALDFKKKSVDLEVDEVVSMDDAKGLGRKRKPKSLSSEDHDSYNFAAERAEAILRLLEDMSDQHNLYITPDTRSYDSVIEAWAKISHIPEAPKRAMSILDKMIERYHKAQTTSQSTMREEDGAELLNREYDTRLLYHPSPELLNHYPPFPNKYTFSACLKAWLFSENRASLAKMEELVEQMKYYSSQGFKDCEADVIVYNILLTKNAKRFNGSVHRLKSTLIHPSSDNDIDTEKAVNLILKEQHSISQNMENVYERVIGGIDDTSRGGLLNKSSALKDEDPRITKISSDHLVAHPALQPDKITYGTMLYAWITHAQSMLMVREKLNISKYDHSIEECAIHAVKFLQYLMTFHINRGDSFEQGGRTVKGFNPATFKDIIEIYIALSETQKAYSVFASVVERLKQRGMYDLRDFVQSTASLLISSVERICHNSNLSSTEWAQIVSLIESILRLTATVKSPTTEMYNAVLQLYIKRMSTLNDSEISEVSNDLIHKSEMLYQAMEANGEGRESKPNKNTYRNLFLMIAKSDPKYAADRAVDLLGKIAAKQHQGIGKYIDIVSFNTVLQLLRVGASEANARKCEKMLSDLEVGFLEVANDTRVRLHIEADQISYSTVMAAYADLPNSFQKVQDIFDSLQDKYMKAVKNGDKHRENKLHPDHKCYNILIGSLLKSNSDIGTAKALKLLEDLELKDLVDVTTYNVIMHVYLSQDRHKDASEMKKRMEQYYTSRNKKFVPTEFTHSAILKIKQPETDHEQSLRELEKASSFDSSIKVSGFNYNTVIKQYIEAGEKGWELKASQLLDDMIQRHEKLGEQGLPAKQILIALNTILKGIRNGGDIGFAHKADEFLRNAKKTLSRINIRLNSFSYSLCMDAWAISRNPSGPKRNFEMLTDLIAHYDEGDKLSAAFLFDVNSFNLVLKACALCPLKSSSDDPNEHTQDISDSPLQLALRTFALLQNNPYNVTPNHLSYSYMIECCGKNLPNNHPQRDVLIIKLFNACCNDGHLSNLVLSSIKQYKSRTGTQTPQLLRWEEYPMEYRRNVQEKIATELKRH